MASTVPAPTAPERPPPTFLDTSTAAACVYPVSIAEGCLLPVVGKAILLEEGDLASYETGLYETPVSELFAWPVADSLPPLPEDTVAPSSTTPPPSSKSRLHAHLDNLLGIVDARVAAAHVSEDSRWEHGAAAAHPGCRWLCQDNLQTLFETVVSPTNLDTTTAAAINLLGSTFKPVHRLHPNLVQLHCVADTEHGPFLVARNYRHSLRTAARCQPYTLRASVYARPPANEMESPQHDSQANSDTKLRFIVYQLLQVIGFLHDRQVAHGSLRPEHIFVTPELFVQLGGFGVPRTPSVQAHATSLWCNGSMSNFQYIMLLNQAAGRHMNSATRHPVIPWVTNFTVRDGGWRDLRRSKFRLNKGSEQLRRTYVASPIPHHVPESLSELTFCVYMARRLPMSLLTREVRRNFRSEEYPSSMARMYEWTPDDCIPSFFTDPSVFKSVHPELPDLILPEWCSTPEEFVRYHMKALESQTVSRDLHHWIDLTFGYLLSGSDAVDALNVPLAPRASPQHLTDGSSFVQLFHSPHPYRHCVYPQDGSGSGGPASSDFRRLSHLSSFFSTGMEFSSGGYRAASAIPPAMVDGTKVPTTMQPTEDASSLFMPASPGFSADGGGRRPSAHSAREAGAASDTDSEEEDLLLQLPPSDIVSALQRVEDTDAFAETYASILVPAYCPPASSSPAADDMFAVGCIIAELYLGLPLFSPAELQAHFELPIGPDGAYHPTAGVLRRLLQLPPDIQEVVRQLIHPVASHRPSAESILHATRRSQYDMVSTRASDLAAVYLFPRYFAELYTIVSELYNLPTWSARASHLFESTNQIMQLPVPGVLMLAPAFTRLLELSPSSLEQNLFTWCHCSYRLGTLLTCQHLLPSLLKLFEQVSHQRQYHSMVPLASPAFMLAALECLEVATIADVILPFLREWLYVSKTPAVVRDSVTESMIMLASRSGLGPALTARLLLPHLLRRVLRPEPAVPVTSSSSEPGGRGDWVLRAVIDICAAGGRGPILKLALPYVAGQISTQCGLAKPKVDANSARWVLGLPIDTTTAPGSPPGPTAAAAPVPGASTRWSVGPSKRGANLSPYSVNVTPSQVTLSKRDDAVCHMLRCNLVMTARFLPHLTATDIVQDVLLTPQVRITQILVACLPSVAGEGNLDDDLDLADVLADIPADAQLMEDSVLDLIPVAIDTIVSVVRLLEEHREIAAKAVEITILPYVAVFLDRVLRLRVESDHFAMEWLRRLCRPLLVVCPLDTWLKVLPGRSHRAMSLVLESGVSASPAVEDDDEEDDGRGMTRGRAGGRGRNRRARRSSWLARMSAQAEALLLEPTEEKWAEATGGETAAAGGGGDSSAPPDVRAQEVSGIELQPINEMHHVQSFVRQYLTSVKALLPPGVPWLNTMHLSSVTPVLSSMAPASVMSMHHMSAAGEPPSTPAITIPETGHVTVFSANPWQSGVATPWKHVASPLPSSHRNTSTAVSTVTSPPSTIPVSTNVDILNWLWGTPLSYGEGSVANGGTLEEQLGALVAGRERRFQMKSAEGHVRAPFVFALKAHEGAVRCMSAYSMSEGVVASGSKDGQFKLWNLLGPSIRCDSTVTPSDSTDRNLRAVTDVSWLESSSLLAALSGNLSVWDTTVIKRVGNFTHSSGPSALVALEPLSRRFHGFDDIVHGPSGEDPRMVLVGTRSSVCCIDIRIMSSWTRAVNEWRLSEAGAWSDYFDAAGSFGALQSVSALAGPHTVAVGSLTGQVGVLDQRTGGLIHSWQAHDAPVLKILPVGPSGLLSVCADGTATLWNMHARPSNAATTSLLKSAVNHVPSLSWSAVCNNVGHLSRLPVATSTSLGGGNTIQAWSTPGTEPLLLTAAQNVIGVAPFPTANEPHPHSEQCYLESRTGRVLSASRLTVTSLCTLPMRQLLLVGDEEGVIRIVSP